MDPKLGAIPALLNAAQVLWQAHMLLGFPLDDILEEKAKELTSIALSYMS